MTRHKDETAFRGVLPSSKRDCQFRRKRFCPGRATRFSCSYGAKERSIAKGTPRSGLVWSPTVFPVCLKMKAASQDIAAALEIEKKCLYLMSRETATELANLKVSLDLYGLQAPSVQSLSNILPAGGGGALRTPYQAVSGAD